MASLTRKDQDQARSGNPSGQDPSTKAQRDEDVNVEDANDRDEISENETSTPAASGAAAAAARPARQGHGFFTIYKSGQGYWTRMGTVMGAGILLLMLAYTIYLYTPTFFPNNAQLGKQVGLYAAAAFVVISGIVGWRLMNKPSNVDFLIATDSEMKKVNWTSRKELIGSTRVVILFMFFIAIFLFGVDEIWGWIMYLAKVLKIPPPPFG